MRVIGENLLADCQVAVELEAVACQTFAAERHTFRLLDKVPEVARGLGAVAGGRAAARDRDDRLEDRQLVGDRDVLGVDLRVGVLRAQPDQAPLDVKVVGRAALAAQLAHVARWVEPAARFLPAHPALPPPLTDEPRLPISGGDESCRGRTRRDRRGRTYDPSIAHLPHPVGACRRVLTRPVRTRRGGNRVRPPRRDFVRC